MSTQDGSPSDHSNASSGEGDAAYRAEIADIERLNRYDPRRVQRTRDFFDDDGDRSDVRFKGARGLGTAIGSVGTVCAVVAAVWDYDALRDGDLSFKAGARIGIEDWEHPHWWRGALLGNPTVVGGFPSSYVTRLRDYVTYRRDETDCLCFYDHFYDDDSATEADGDFDPADVEEDDDDVEEDDDEEEEEEEEPRRPHEERTLPGSPDLSYLGSSDKGERPMTGPQDDAGRRASSSSSSSTTTANTSSSRRSKRRHPVEDDDDDDNDRPARSSSTSTTSSSSTTKKMRDAEKKTGAFIKLDKPGAKVHFTSLPVPTDPVPDENGRLAYVTNSLVLSLCSKDSCLREALCFAAGMSCAALGLDKKVVTAARKKKKCKVDVPGESIGLITTALEQQKSPLSFRHRDSLEGQWIPLLEKNTGVFILLCALDNNDRHFLAFDAARRLLMICPRKRERRDGEDDLSYFLIAQDSDLRDEATTAAFLYDTYRLKCPSRIHQLMVNKKRLAETNYGNYVAR